MKASTLIWALHPAVTGKETAAPAQAEAVSFILAQEGGGLIKTHSPGLSLSTEGAIQQGQVSY